ncbi:hypothetical protein AUEXF2481DRAFT_31840 [Aureobasidium subglaciale EXF-2481]|uniref:Uncharacterized protein n=1 Tax=Aureobasidium subglaciale (strain EXF-2481) TaxID=1043005 RepID=A0A074Z1M0_AURSE|nr:uncharacterized protein AUEXF2481DRAFT_31840 [Aureobasidium subglaciale EXF-2481]KAI5196644.1 hypothetical protein E4T38_08391 [Aureobasidium subglaciale]KAI5215509.1 hypothetical protein E4T40_08341 [Aureobasidium subglaciale]KAI5218651.1 hypothetical protein E4T41_08285 [Aureobasidium subglaciale]KAI5256173.1 hypothetical protein E4T46_08320 [Aureobasidium subglaciale]KEQ92981.1 hypothetical protein AUEXF2481DRAFT_31840 [Aureobasidium subglaciale EXF-2481]
MQRCCARIAGLRTFAPPPFLHRIPYRRYARHSPPLGQDAQPASAEEAFDRLVGADNESFDTLDSRLTGSPRQPSSKRTEAQRKHGDTYIDWYIDRSKLPARDASHLQEAWMPTIEAALPARLRSPKASLVTEEAYSAKDISCILHVSTYTYKHDLLNYLANKKNRPKAAVWLASMAISHDFQPDPPPPRDTNVWNTCLQHPLSLSAYTEQLSVRLEPSPYKPPDHLPPPASLDHLTQELHPHHNPLPRTLRHETIGLIWQSLAKMILSDASRANKDHANQAIKPEILEIIAMLHHTGAMPASIYSYQPPDDPISLCQPPTLHLLSNQIITSLTDAAWRAHETNIVEEAKERGGAYDSSRPEIPGSMYKVHVTGLGHEVWLELVLWACLYGRFYKQGVKILMQMANSREWSVLSWRELANPIVKSGQEKSINWDEVKYIFNTGIADPDRIVNQKRVHRTVSAEVISSFIDASVSHVNAGVGSRGMIPENPARFLSRMKMLFNRNNMSLGYTSWDAIILRFFESKGVDFEKDPDLASKVNSISSLFGDDISTVNAPTRDQLWQPTPAYVLDGSAASIGYHHRLLRAHIKLGSLSGAMSVVRQLQEITDTNKERSIHEFFTKQQDAVVQSDHDDTSEFGFQGRYGGIHYPSFFPQIPVPLLADLLNLVVDSNALELGSWLVYSGDLDGPIIHKGLYADPVMGPSLVRLAALLADEALMRQVFKDQKQASQADLPKEVLNVLIDQQIEAENWPFVDRALEGFAKLPGYSINMNTTATMASMILREASASPGDLPALEKSASAKTFRKMSSFQSTGNASGYRTLNFTKTFELGTRIWRLLALVNDDWNKYAWKVYPKMAGRGEFRFKARAFNKILSGVVETYGSAVGKEYLGKFWPQSLETHPSSMSNNQGVRGGVPRMAARRAGTPIVTSDFSGHSHADHRIHIHGPNDKQASIDVYLGSGPDLATIRLILHRALQEVDGSYASIRNEVEWSWRMMTKLGLPNHHIRNELKNLPELADHPELFLVVERYHDTEADDLENRLDNDLDDDLNDGLKDKAQE